MTRYSLPPFLTLCLASSLFAQALPDGALKGYRAISHSHVYDVNRELASNRFGGRLTGSDSYTEAARWAASLLKQWGVAPCGTGMTYLQEFACPYTIVRSASMTLLLPGPDGKEQTVPLRLGPDFLPMLNSDTGEKSALLVFAGWGISAPELGYDDYAGIDARHRFVLCFRGAPKRDDTLMSPYNEHRKRLKTALEKGAEGLFYLYDTPIANPNSNFLEGFAPAMLSFRVADSIFALRGIRTAALRDSLAAHYAPLSFEIPARVNYAVTSEHHAEGIGYNIVGYVEGVDPGLRNECIVIGAHFDHCGTHAGIMFPGADDNASGSADVLEIAHAFAQLGSDRPKRSVVFALFGGEEMGLKGSYYMSNNFPPQFTRVAGMVNLDMTGEGDGAWCGYSAKDSTLKALLEAADTGTKIVRGSNPMSTVTGMGGTDYVPFFKKEILCFTFGSNGPHLAYHQAGDTIYRINPEILADIARLGYAVTYLLANR